MVLMQIHPQEMEVWYLIPAIRSGLCSELANNGFSQKKIAQIIGVTEAAVSQYLNKKRAQKIKLSERFVNEIKLAGKKVALGEIEAFTAIQILCREFKHSKEICEMHKKLENISKNCNACFE